MKTIQGIILICILFLITIPPIFGQERITVNPEKIKRSIDVVITPKLRKAFAYDKRKASTLEAYMQHMQTAVNIVPPSTWFSQRQWSPRRHFGPIYGNSPDLHLSANVATFVYNNYFEVNSDADVFKKYYGSSLPSNKPTSAGAIPGSISQNGFGDVRLGFQELTYSSKYGGSFKLSFQSMEDLQIEYRKDNSAWDIASLAVSVYVTPVARDFNPNVPIMTVPTGNIHVEFRPQGVIGYSISSGTLIEQQGDMVSSLMTALEEASQNIVAGTNSSPFRLNAARFSYGLTHAQFWEEIGQTNNVTGIEISEGFFFPRTSQGFPVAVVDVRVSKIKLDTEYGSEEIYIRLDAEHMFSRDPAGNPVFSWNYPEIDDNGSTGWQTVGVFPLEFECEMLESVILMTIILEDDDIIDDRFSTDPSAFQTSVLPCSDMLAAFNNGEFGFYKYLPDQQLLILDDDEDVIGALTVSMRLSVIKQ